MPQRSLQQRRAAHRRGHAAETLALVLLLAKGYRSLARRFKAAGGEIDLVMRRGGLVAFVEVKARHDLEAALLSIDGRKRERFSRAARAWIARHPHAAGLELPRRRRPRRAAALPPSRGGRLRADGVLRARRSPRLRPLRQTFYKESGPRGNEPASQVVQTVKLFVAPSGGGPANDPVASCRQSRPSLPPLGA
jgi:putative endonuclease